MLKIGLPVVRAGKHTGDDPVTIPVPEELETVPGIPLNNREVYWYAREYPLESQNNSERSNLSWFFTNRHSHAPMKDIDREHEALSRGMTPD